MTSTENMSIEEVQQEVIEEFGLFDDWMQKYEYLIELGKDLPLIEDALKVDENLIKGCQSRVWLHAKMNDGKLEFFADSDAIITKGLVALVIRVLSGHSPKEIIEAELNFIPAIGLSDHLSPTRSNGLASMVKNMKLYALAFQVEQA